ncbi:TrbI/VirB10 family protein [Candidatus Hepatincola sp. Av]
MKLINFKYIVVLITMPSLLFALESDEAKFIAKDRESTLRIVNYKAEMDKKRQEEKEAKERRKQEEKEKKLKQEEAKAKEDREKKEELEIKARKLREEQRRKLEEEKRVEAEIETRRKRLSSVKLVKVEDKDRIDFDKKPSFYMESFSDLNTPEDTVSSVVSKDNIVTTDQYIRLLLETNINSRRGGEFVAIVEKNVYSQDSKKVLIGKGSKFICSFEPLEKYGETALNAECNRVYLADGRSIVLSAGKLSDGMGRAGLSGELDNRTWEKYGQTFMMSVLGGVAMMGADKIPDDDIGSLAQYTALNVIDTATQILDETMDLAPVVIIPSATRIILKPTIDINFKDIKEGE